MIYIVKAGDTLFGIAKNYTGDGNRYRELLPANPQITNPNLIEIGDMINIPSSWGKSGLPAVVTPSSTPQTQGKSNLNQIVILVSVVAVASAAAYYYLGRSAPNQTAIASNPEEEEVEESEDE